MVQFQRKNRRQLEVLSMRKNIVSLVILLGIGFLRCLQLDDDSCSENSSLSSQGTCECDLDYFKISNAANKFACKKCIECKEKCEGRNFRCNENKPHPIHSIQSCIPPRKGYFVLHSEFEKCGPECGHNEDETVKCGCNQNRRCECKRHFYKDSQGVCTKLCSKCLSHGQRRVPDYLGCTKMPWNERCVEKENPPTAPIAKLSSTPNTTEKSSEEKNRTHAFTTKKPFISKAKNNAKIDLTVGDDDNGIIAHKVDKETIGKYTLYFVPLGCIAVAFAVAFRIYKLFKRRKRNHNTFNSSQEAEERIPLDTIQTSSTVATGTFDPNSNNLSNLNFENLVGKIPKAILDSVAESWSLRFKSTLEMPCTKAEKDAYIKVAFKDDKDQFKIIRFTDTKEYNYSAVMAYVKTRKPKYTLEKLLEHMFESNNYDLVEMLAEEIMKNKEMYMKKSEMRCEGSGTINICVER